MTDEEKIRLFEHGILDNHYKTIEFFKYSDDLVIPYLLQSFGDTERHSSSLLKKGFTETQISFFLNNMVHGISHCIRWIKTQKQPGFMEISDYTAAHTMSMDFIGWGIDYNNICQEFITWSRKYKSIELDEKEKTIKFITPDNLDYTKIFGNQILHWQQYHEPQGTLMNEIIDQEFQLWSKDIDLEKPPIFNYVVWDRPRRSKIYPIFLSHFQKLILPELPGETDLNGYTLNQLRQFYTLFHINFLFICTFEMSLDAKIGMENSFGSNPLYLSSKQFIQLSIKITGLPENIVVAIIHDFTFDSSQFNSRISIQPFIQSNSDVYYILPNLFIHVHPSRMITGILNTKNKRRVYEQLINQIEKQSLCKIGKAIKNHTGWRYFIEKNIKSKGRQYQPDIIVIDVRTSSILVVEYKHYISPIMAAEVTNRIKEIEKALQRLQEYKAALVSLSSISNIDIQHYKVFSILLTHRPLPVPLPLTMDSVISDSITFEQILSQNSQDLSLINMTAILANKEKDLISDNITLKIEKIKVENWTVERTLHLLNNNKNN